jgi:peptide deformylase
MRENEMAVLPICHVPNAPVLRQKAKKVSRIDDSIEQLIDGMIQTMQQGERSGIGSSSSRHIAPGYCCPNA